MSEFNADFQNVHSTAKNYACHVVVNNSNDLIKTDNNKTTPYSVLSTIISF